MGIINEGEEKKERSQEIYFLVYVDAKRLEPMTMRVLRLWAQVCLAILSAQPLLAAYLRPPKEIK